MSIRGYYRLNVMSSEAASELDKAVEEARSVLVQIEATTSSTDNPYRKYSYEGERAKDIDVAYLKELITPDLKGYIMYVNYVDGDGLITTFVFRED